jgi:hypothetical protein
LRHVRDWKYILTIRCF